MNIMAGLLLALIGFVGLVFQGSGSDIEQVLGSAQLAYLAGVATFLMGVFHLLPRPWRWGNTMTPFKRVLRQGWGIISALTGLAGLGLIIDAAIFVQSFPPGFVAVEILTGGGLILGAAGQLRQVWLSREKELADAGPPGQADETNVLLRIARAHSGRLTPGEVAAASNMHYRRAAELLEVMAADGVCQARVNAEGTTFYLFPEFAGAAGKRDIMENNEVVFDHETEKEFERAVQASASVNRD